MASANGSTSNGNGGTSYSSNYPIYNQSVGAGASGAGSSESKTVDSGPSQVLNGWDDPIDGWELQPSYHAYGDVNNNGKAPWDTASNGSGSFTKVKPSRKAGSSVFSAPTYSGRGRGSSRGNTSPRGRGTPPGRGAGRGKSFNGGGRAKPNSAWGPNQNPNQNQNHNANQSQSQNARQFEDHGGASATRVWEKAVAVPAAPAPSLSPELNGWQHVGSQKSRNGSDSSSRSGPGGQNSKAWHQGARATTQLVSAGSAGSSVPQGGEAGSGGAGGEGYVDYPASTYSDSQCSELDDHMDDDSDDAFFSDDSFSHNAHDDEKKIKWFRDFFQDLDGMTDAQCNEHDRQWHCPACNGGPGAIDWFRGLAPLATHARTMRSRRVKLHRKFAEVLEEELRIRRAPPPPLVGADGAQLAFRKWKGLSEETEVQQQVLVIWPPIVIIQNTQLEQDEEAKWTGMGNKELVDMFKDYNPLKPRHAYGPLGHRGMSLLIFSDSPAGYHDAVRLGNHFLNLRRGKDDWNRTSKLMFRPGGNRILYGYMAAKEDLDVFNRHSKGKTLVKFDVRRLQEVVLEPMQRMQQENKQMQLLQSEHNSLKNAASKTSRNLQLREEELKVLRERTEKQHADNKRQLLDMEEFYHQDSAQWADEVKSKDTELQKLRNDFDKMYQSRRQELNAQRSNLCTSQEQQTLMTNDIQEKMKKVEGSLQEAQDFENKLEELEQKHHERRVQFQKQQHQALLAFEQQIKTERTNFLHSFEMQMQIQ